MRSPTILIADDETHILNVLALKLDNAGYHTITAQDGQEAYDLACAHSPDLVISDFQMPRLSGLELCSRMRSNPLTQDIPTVILTARGFSITDAQLCKDNIRKVITKPFSPREVLSMVEEIVGPAAKADTFERHECPVVV